MKIIRKQITFKSLLVLFVILFSKLSLYSQSGIAKSRVSITVHVQDSSLVKSPLTLKLFKDYINNNTGSVDYTVLADKNGYYHFLVNDVHEMMNYSLRYDALSFGFLNGYIEPGDNVVLDFRGHKSKRLQITDYVFSGKGSQKYIAKMELIYKIPSVKIRTISANKTGMDLLNQHLANADSNYYFYKSILNKYKPNITNEAYQAMDADIYGRAYSSIFGYLPEFLKSNESVSVRDSIMSFQTKLQDRTFPGNSPRVIQSPEYLTFLLSRARSATFLKYRNTKIQDMYEELILQNNGKVREKILMSYLIGRGGSQKENKMDSIYRDALKYVSQPPYRALLIRLASALKVGSAAYPFRLPDSCGKIVSLKDFKGKVILIDCWFTGCGACADLAKIIDDYILPKYILNKDVVFISVCVDSTPEKWKKSLKAGTYTNSKSINLFTEGLALDHPFIKNYQFYGFPQLLLVDKKGNIFSPSLPRNPKDMIEVIEQARNAK